jgi:hypothetical protein
MLAIETPPEDESASLRVAVIFEPTVDVVNPVSNVTADAIPAWAAVL